MSKNFEKYKDNIEPYNRFCPICGVNIKKGSISHRCDDNKLKELERKEINKEKKVIKKRTFDDRLKEHEDLITFNDNED